MNERTERANVTRASNPEELVRLDPLTGSRTSDCILVNFNNEHVIDLY